MPNYQKTVGNFSYNLSNVIGEGASAKVYKGKDIHSGQPVAVKVIELGQIENEVQITLLRNETGCYKILNHQNIVKVYDQKESLNRVYIISEFCEGGNLFDYMKRNGRLPQDQAIQLLYQIVKAVNHVHSMGIVHRDIKSANILLKANMTVKLADFGMAGSLKPYDMPEEYNVGSPLYMSPQAYMYSQYSVKSDCWSIGMIFYELLMGCQPFMERTIEELMYFINTEQIYSSLPKITPFSRLLLERMLQKDSKSRTQTNELLGYLSNYVTTRNKQKQKPSTCQSTLGQFQRPRTVLGQLNK